MGDFFYKVGSRMGLTLPGEAPPKPPAAKTEKIEPKDEYFESGFKMKPLEGQPAWFPKNLHITIDDGPNLERLEKILDVLKKYDVKVTFFFIGSRIQSYLKSGESSAKLENLFKRLIDEGHRIGYHSYHHCHSAGAAEEIVGCNGKTFAGFSSWELLKDFRRFERVLNLSLGFTYSLGVARVPGSTGGDYAHIKRRFKRYGLGVPKGWHFSDMLENGKFKKYLKDGPALEKLVTKIKDRSPDHTILLLHEKPNRALFLDLLLEKLKSQ